MQKQGYNTVVLIATSFLGIWRMFVISQTRQLDMQKVISHQLGPVPWSLADADGSTRKTNKTKIVNYMGQKVLPVESVIDGSACITDGKTIVQKVNESNQTFSTIARFILKIVLQEGNDMQEICYIRCIY